jgi:hypothetical protein
MGKIGRVFACGERTNGRTAERMPRLESARRVGLSTMSSDKLMVAGECLMGALWKGGKMGKIGEIGNAFACGGRRNGAMAKRRPRLEPGGRIGLSTISSDKLMIVGE